MLLVIVGAGASYDAIPRLPPPAVDEPDPSDIAEDRLPLANELFGNRKGFLEILKRHPRCHPIVPRLALAARGGVAIEKELQRIQEDCETYPEGHSQLAAVRFYLQALMWDCEDAWREHSFGVTNHHALIDQIRRWHAVERVAQPVWFATFNYDHMIEHALLHVGCRVDDTDDDRLHGYVRDARYKVVKLHGSKDWGREIVDAPPGTFDPERLGDSWRLMEALTQAAADLKFGAHRRLEAPQVLYGRYRAPAVHFRDRGPGFPAISIPVETKSDFECPPDHLNALAAAAPKIEKVIVIGWRGADTHLVDFLRKSGFPQFLPALIVGSSCADAEDTGRRLEEAGLVLDYRGAPYGFSGCAQRGVFYDFLAYRSRL